MPSAARPPGGPPVRHETFPTARRRGGPDRRGDRPADRGRGAARATSRCWSGRTATPSRSCAASTRPASRGGSRGPSGLYARPEVRRLLAFLRAIADLGSSVDVYAVATGEPYDLGGEDLTAIVTSARRRNRTVWEVLEELERQPGILRIAPATRTAVARLVGDLRDLSELAHERPAGEVLYAFLRRTGTLTRLAAEPTVRAEEALRNIARFFEIVAVAVRRCWRTIARRSSPGTSRR